MFKMIVFKKKVSKRINAILHLKQLNNLQCSIASINSNTYKLNLKYLIDY